MELVKKIESMVLIDKLRVLKWMVRKGIDMKECNDGTRINLDRLTQEELEGLEVLVELLETTYPLEARHTIE